MDQFKDFPDNSRVWLYQTNRALSKTEEAYLREQLLAFTKEWAAHGKQLWASAEVLNPYFVGVVVDESVTPPSGCSIDASVKFLKELGKELEIDFFTRMKLTIEVGGKLSQIDFHDLSNIENKENTQLFDPLVSDLTSLRNNWPLAIKDSSLKTML